MYEFAYFYLPISLSACISCIVACLCHVDDLFPSSLLSWLRGCVQRWNDIGIVKQYNAEEENSIDVEFHDTSTHHSMHIANASNFTMADLTSDAVLLATTDDGEGNR